MSWSDAVGSQQADMDFKVADFWTKAADVLAATLIVLTVGYLAVLAAARSLPGYGTENDFIGSMVGEAARVLNGEPLQTKFHPPFFSLTLATVNSVVGDWFIAGKFISLISAAITLISTHIFFRLLFNAWVGLGAVIGLISGAVFWEYAVMATSDIYMLALYSLTLMMAALAAKRQRITLWFAVGFIIVLTLMTRTNGVTLVLLLALPLLQADTPKKITAFLASLAGFAIAILGFIGFAFVTGSSLMPEGTHHNLALTYFTEERISWEGMIEARSRFNSLSEVLLYDPAAMAKGFLRDLYDVGVKQAPYLAGPILALLFLPGLIIAGLYRRGLFFLAFLAITVAQLLLVNLKAYEPRYHIYLMPWIGAGAAFFCIWLFDLRKSPDIASRIIVIALTAAILIGPVLAARHTSRIVAAGSNPELANVLNRVSGELGDGDTVFARKTHLAFYTGAEHIRLWDADTEDELREFFDQAVAEGRRAEDVHLFIGIMERRKRPGVTALVASGLDWLTPVVAEEGARGWTLYRYTPSSGT